MVKITAIGCCHGAYHHLDLPGGDILLITGDLTARSRPSEYDDFQDWLREQDYREKIIIGGNHDIALITDLNGFLDYSRGDSTYLENSGTEYQYSESHNGVTRDMHSKTLKIWGSPNSLYCDGMDPDYSAFTGNEMDLEREYAKIPNDIDILITHAPPYLILDGVERQYDGSYKFHTGSRSLRDALDRIKPRYHFFSHIHEHGGKQLTYVHRMGDKKETICINCSIRDERYKVVNKPINIEIK